MKQNNLDKQVIEDKVRSMQPRTGQAKQICKEKDTTIESENEK